MALMIADRAEVSWDHEKSQRLVRIHVGEEVIRRHWKSPRDAKARRAPVRPTVWRAIRHVRRKTNAHRTASIHNSVRKYGLGTKSPSPRAVSETIRRDELRARREI
jgi:hypothetical protein